MCASANATGQYGARPMAVGVVDRGLPETGRNAEFERVTGRVLSGSLAAGQQPKLVLVMHTLPVKLDDKSAEAVGWLV